MPRYELVEGTSSKFWQIELDGASFKTTHGRIGTNGSTLLKEWPDEETAQKEHDKLIAQKTKKGYELVDDGSAAPKKKAAKKAAPVEVDDEEDEDEAPAPKKGAKKVAKPIKKGPEGANFNAQLAKQIDADPTDDAAWSVYADWLQGEGDPRGELGSTQEQLRASPKDKTLASAEKKLLKQNADHFVGKFLSLMTTEKKKDLPSVLAKQMLEPQFRQSDDNSVPIRVYWKSGFFTQLNVGHPGWDYSPPGSGDEDGEGGGGGDVDIPKILEELLAHPSARFLTTLRLGMPMDPDDGEQSYGDVIKVLAKSPALGRLRELYIGDITQEESEISWINIGDISKLYAGAKNLRVLTLHGGSDLKLGTMALPELRELTIITGGLDKKNIASLCAAKLPKLEKLELWTGNENYGANSSVKDLKPILDGKVFPKLKELGICNCEYADDVAAALGASKILARIEALDLSGGTLGDDGVTAMLEHADAFAHLRKMNIADNFVAKTSAAASKLCKAVRTRPQRTPDNYDGESRRYVTLGE